MSRLKQLKNHINNMIKQTQLECIDRFKQSDTANVSELHGKIKAYWEMLDVIDNFSNKQRLGTFKHPETIQDLNLSVPLLQNICKTLHINLEHTKEQLENSLELYRIENDFKIGMISSYSGGNNNPLRPVLYSPYIHNPDELECIDLTTGEVYNCSRMGLVTCQK